MPLLIASFPLALLLVIGVLHVVSITYPSNGSMTIGQYALGALVLALFFYLPQELARKKPRISILSIQAAHLYAPRSSAISAYCLLGVSLFLLGLSLLAEFDTWRRATALWLCFLACPSVVWLHAWTKGSPDQQDGSARPGSGSR
jgi:hypothetical protein